MILNNSRSKLIIGENNINKLANKRILLFGLGGVGGACFDSLVRSNISYITIVDGDKYHESNYNRQIQSFSPFYKMSKALVCKDIAYKINEKCQVNAIPAFYYKDNVVYEDNRKLILKDEKNKTYEIDFSTYDYVIDCIDTVTAKIDIIVKAKNCNVNVISAMGCGNRLDPRCLTITDIYKTSNDPLCKVMRYELKKRGITSLCCIYSTELPIKNESSDNKIGSMYFVPNSAGILIGYKVVSDLIS